MPIYNLFIKYNMSLHIKEAKRSHKVSYNNLHSCCQTKKKALNITGIH